MRKELKLNQSQFAELIGTNVCNQSILERGDAALMRIEVIASLVTVALKMGFSLEWLFLGKGELREAPKAGVIPTLELYAELGKRISAIAAAVDVPKQERGQ